MSYSIEPLKTVGNTESTMIAFNKSWKSLNDVRKRSLANVTRYQLFPQSCFSSLCNLLFDQVFCRTFSTNYFKNEFLPTKLNQINNARESDQEVFILKRKYIMIFLFWDSYCAREWALFGINKEISLKISSMTRKRPKKLLCYDVIFQRHTYSLWTLKKGKPCLGAFFTKLAADEQFLYDTL